MLKYHIIKNNTAKVVTRNYNTDQLVKQAIYQNSLLIKKIDKIFGNKRGSRFKKTPKTKKIITPIQENKPKKAKIDLKYIYSSNSLKILSSDCKLKLLNRSKITKKYYDQKKLNTLFDLADPKTTKSSLSTGTNTPNDQTVLDILSDLESQKTTKSSLSTGINTPNDQTILDILSDLESKKNTKSSLSTSINTSKNKYHDKILSDSFAHLCDMIYKDFIIKLSKHKKTTNNIKKFLKKLAIPTLNRKQNIINQIQIQLYTNTNKAKAMMKIYYHYIHNNKLIDNKLYNKINKMFQQLK